MKKLLLVMVLVLGALVVNAQRTPVKVSDLPKGVADSIQKEYSGYTIKESARNVENNVTTYEVVVSKGSDQKTLHFDNQGKSLKSKGMDLNLMIHGIWTRKKAKLQTRIWINQQHQVQLHQAIQVNTKLNSKFNNSQFNHQVQQLQVQLPSSTHLQLPGNSGGLLLI